MEEIAVRRTMRGLLSLFLLLFALPLSLSQNVSFLFAIVSVDGPSGFVSPNCSESNVRGTAFDDPRNLDGWLTATSWGEFGLAPENETLIISRNVTLNATCDLFSPSGVLGQIAVTINGSWDFVIFIMPTVADLASVGVNCTGNDIETFAFIGAIFRCFAPADYARVYSLISLSYRRTNALCPCAADPFLSNCTDETCIVAGDLADILQGGDALDRTLNAPNREEVLGSGPWLHVIPDTLGIVGDFDFELPDLATGPPNETLALKIRNLDDATWLYVSCRSPETVFYDEGNAANNVTMMHIHAVDVGANPFLSNATLIAFVPENEFFSFAFNDTTNFTDVVLVIGRNPAPVNVCSVFVGVTGFAAENGTLGGAVFDGPSSSPVVAGLMKTIFDDLFILEIDQTYLPGEGSALLGPVSASPPPFPGPLGNASIARLVAAVFEELIANSTVLDDPEASLFGNWTNSSDPSGAFSGFFLETETGNSSAVFAFPIAFPRPLLCRIYVYWMHTVDPLSTAFNISEDRSNSVPVSIVGSFVERAFLLDQSSGGGGGEFTGSGAQMKGFVGEEFLDSASNVTVNSVLNESVSLDGVEFSCFDPLRGKVGNLSLLVIEVNITDGVYSGSPACSREDVVLELEEVVARDSFGSARFEPIVTTEKNLTIPGAFNLSTCAYFEWARKLFQNVFEFENKTLVFPPLAGERVPDFDYIFLIFPNDTGCEWDLLSGLSHPLSIITDCERAGHAFGHNLGLGHAGDENCTDPCVAENSLMGTGTVLNAPMRIGAGWLFPNRILEVDTTGEFVLDRLDLPINESLPLAIAIGIHFVSCRNASIDVHLYDSGFPAPAFYLHSELLASLTTNGSTHSFVSVDLRIVNVTAIDVQGCSLSLDLSESFLLGACCFNFSTCFQTSVEPCRNASANATFFVGESCDICETLEPTVTTTITTTTITTTTSTTTTSTTSTLEMGACCFLILGTPTCSPFFSRSACENQPGGVFSPGIVCGSQVGCCDVADFQCRNLTFSQCCTRNSSIFIAFCGGGFDPCDFGLTSTTSTSTTTSSTATTKTTSSFTTTTSSTVTTTTTTTVTTSTVTTTTTSTVTTSTATTTTTTVPPPIPVEVWLLVPICAGICCVLAFLCLFILRKRRREIQTASARRRRQTRKPLLR